MKRIYVIVDSDGQYWNGGSGFVDERHEAAKWTSLKSASQVLAMSSRLTGCTLQAWRPARRRRA